MKYPQAWNQGRPVELSAFKSDLTPPPKKEEPKPKQLVAAPTKIEADGDVARWWTELSDAGKAEYVAEHPNSKYADMHRKSKVDMGAPAGGHPNDKKGPGQHSAPPVLKNHDTGEGKSLSGPSAMPGQGHEKPKTEQEKTDSIPHRSHENEETENRKSEPTGPKPGLRDFVHPDMKAGSPKRKAAVAFLKKKSGHILSHLKKDAHEWKSAGAALKKLASRQPLTHEDKHAMGAVAADLAAVTASVLMTGGAAHGVVLFMQHFGTHLATEAMLKSAVKGSAGHAVHHASVLTTASDEDQIMQHALEYMMDVLEIAVLEALMKKFEAEAKKEGKGDEAKKDVREAALMASGSKLTAKLDMSAEVAGKGMCPDCKRPMIVAMIGNVPSWSCEHDRISLPLPDDHEYFSTGNQGPGSNDLPVQFGY